MLTRDPHSSLTLALRMLRVLRPLQPPLLCAKIRPRAGVLAHSCFRLGIRSSANFVKTERAQKAETQNLRAKLSPSTESSNKEFSRLYDLVKQEKWHLATAMAFLLVSSSISLSLPAAIGKILDAVNDSSQEKLILGFTLSQFMAGMAGIFVVGAASTYGRIVTLRSIGERLVAKLRSRTFKKIVEQDAEFFDVNRTGDLLSRLGTDANVVSRSVTQNIADGLRAIITATLGLGMMSYISVKLTLVITATLPPVLIATWLYGRKVRQISRRFQVTLGDLTRVGEERLNNIRTAQSFGGEQQEIKLYNQRIRSVYNVGMEEAKATGRYTGVMQLTGNMVVIGLLALGANMVSNGSLTFGELTSFIMYTAFSGSAISGLGNFYSELMKGAGAASRLFEVEDRKPVIPPFRGQPLRNPKGNIVFSNVYFAYPTRPAVDIFQGLDVTIKSGSHVCIVGQSGGGKSTILSLLLRLYDPTSGSISIGGQDLSDVSPWSLRRNIGVVSQEPVLYNGTVAENIEYGKPGASRTEILDAARSANCTFLADFPQGIDTQVGPRGAQLSGGQKQRIAIARALISKPSILVLDEATSALDSESEMLVNEALAKLIKQSGTTISIAHRLSTIARSDEVIVLGSGGKAIEQGGFSELYRDPDSALSQLLLTRHEVLKDKTTEAEQEHEEDPHIDEDLPPEEVNPLTDKL